MVRLWVSSQDFRNDIIVSEERIGKVSETYRGLRNALRYQLANLYDFDPAKHSVPVILKTTAKNGSLANYAACYVVHQAQPANFGAPPFAPMGIDRGSAAAADMHASDASTNKPKPAYNGRLRPNRSSSGPYINCPAASPAK